MIRRVVAARPHAGSALRRVTPATRRLRGPRAGTERESVDATTRYVGPRRSAAHARPRTLVLPIGVAKPSSNHRSSGQNDARTTRAKTIPCLHLHNHHLALSKLLSPNPEYCPITLTTLNIPPRAHARAEGAGRRAGGASPSSRRERRGRRSSGPSQAYDSVVWQ